MSAPSLPHHLLFPSMSCSNPDAGSTAAQCQGQLQECAPSTAAPGRALRRVPCLIQSCAVAALTNLSNSILNSGLVGGTTGWSMHVSQGNTTGGNARTRAEGSGSTGAPACTHMPQSSSGGCWAGAWTHMAVAMVGAAVEAEATAVGAVAAGMGGALRRDRALPCSRRPVCQRLCHLRLCHLHE